MSEETIAERLNMMFYDTEPELDLPDTAESGSISNHERQPMTRRESLARDKADYKSGCE